MGAHKLTLSFKITSIQIHVKHISPPKFYYLFKLSMLICLTPFKVLHLKVLEQKPPIKH